MNNHRQTFCLTHVYAQTDKTDRQTQLRQARSLPSHLFLSLSLSCISTGIHLCAQTDRQTDRHTHTHTQPHTHTHTCMPVLCIVTYTQTRDCAHMNTYILVGTGPCTKQAQHYCRQILLCVSITDRQTPCQHFAILYYAYRILPVAGIFPSELTRVLTPFLKNSFGWEYKPRSSLCTHAFHRTD